MVADVGARIRSLPTAKGLTQAQLAEPQYTKAYISILEAGRTRASMKALLAAAYARTYAYEEAIRVLKECVQACDDGVVKNPALQFRRLVDLAVAQTNQRQAKQALLTYERAIALSEEFGDRASMGPLYAGIAKAHHDAGDLEAAILNSQKSLHIYEDLGLMDQVACALDNAAALYVEHGNTTRARECLARAARIAEEVRRDTTLASIRASEAELLARTDTDAALEQAQQVLKFARRVEQPDAQVRMLLLTGELRMKTSSATARRSFQEARQLAEEKAPQLLRIIFDRWSRAAEAGGDSDEALRLARRALETVRVWAPAPPRSSLPNGSASPS